MPTSKDLLKLFGAIIINFVVAIIYFFIVFFIISLLPNNLKWIAVILGIILFIFVSTLINSIYLRLIGDEERFKAMVTPNLFKIMIFFSVMYLIIGTIVRIVLEFFIKESIYQYTVGISVLILFIILILFKNKLRKKFTWLRDFV